MDQDLLGQQIHTLEKVRKMNIETHGDNQEQKALLDPFDEYIADQICTDEAEELSLFPVGHANYASSSRDAFGAPDTSHDAEYAASLQEEQIIERIRPD